MISTRSDDVEDSETILVGLPDVLRRRWSDADQRDLGVRGGGSIETCDCDVHPGESDGPGNDKGRAVVLVVPMITR